MKQLLITSVLLFFIQGTISAQSNMNSMVNNGIASLNNNNNADALKLFREVYNKAGHGDSSYPKIAFYYAISIFKVLMDATSHERWDEALSLSDDFINVVEKNKEIISPELYAKRYWVYKNYVMAYFGLGQKEKALPYQQKLYSAYKTHDLPSGIDKYYNFEKFTLNKLNVWGYEWYPNLGDPETEGSFSKHVYYIYTTDENGNDKEQLYTLHTVKVHKLTDDEPDFVLTKRMYNDSEETSETSWSCTFTNPIDYTKLHNVVIEYVKGNIKGDGLISIIKRK